MDIIPPVEAPKKEAENKPDAHANHGGHDGPQMKLEPMGTFKVILFAAAFVLLFAALFVLGLIPSIQKKHLAEKEAGAAHDSKPIVDVAMPSTPKELPTLQLPGSAQAFQTTAIFPRTSGYLKQRLVDIGDKVVAGQLLAEIDAPEVIAQLAAANATLQQATATAQRSKDDYDLAEATYQRYQGFAKGGGVTQQQLDERKSTYTQAKSNLAGAEASVRADQAEIDRLTALVSFARVVAPFNGVITNRNYDVGALLTESNVGAGHEMFDIAQTDTLRIFIDVPQTYSTYVKVGQEAKFAVSNYPGRLFDGKIARTANSIDQTTRTLRTEVDVPNTNSELFAGMYGYVHYEIQQPQKQLLIPTSALVFAGNGLQVAVLDGSNRVKFTKIKLGRDLGTDVEVVEGLSAKDRVVANPGERLSDGVEVKIAAKGGDDSKTAGAPASDPKLAGQREALAK